MKISIPWIKKYVPLKASVDIVAHKLTMAGLEVEKMEKVNGDDVFELEITPNRADCLNMVGMARELSAIFNLPLNQPKISKAKVCKKQPKITLLDKKGCPRYIGVLIENVNVEPSSKALKRGVESIGSRGINNAVDITNFCLMELGQPLHVFDYDKLEGGEINVRRAKSGETIMTLEDQEKELDSSILVIADKSKPVAIAGIIGGKNTGVTEQTKNILLESAYFEPTLIRRAARKLGISTDSSYRFERGVVFDAVETGSQRAVDLIVEHCKGIVTGRKDAKVSQKSKTAKSISITLGQINDYLGSSVSLTQCTRLLKKLEFKVKAIKDKLTVTPPSFRTDIKIKEDVIEEVARIVGYDNLPSSFPSISPATIPVDKKRHARGVLRQEMKRQGLSEIITYSMISRKVFEALGCDESSSVKVKNPLTLQQEFMRPSMLPAFLDVLLSNINKSQKNVKFFEIGKIYLASGEKDVCGVLLTGQTESSWKKESSFVDFYDLKGIVEVLLETSHLSSFSLTLKDNPLFVNGESAVIRVGKNEIGFMGKVAQSLLSSWDIKQKDVYFASFNLDCIYKKEFCLQKYKKISEFPAISRDISLAAKKDVSFVQVKEVVSSLGIKELTSLQLVEVYSGDKLPEGFDKAFIFSLTFQLSSRTLTDEEISQKHAVICKELEEKLDVVLR